MSVTENAHETADHGAGESGHHESPQDRHKKEHIALWLFIGGDALFLKMTRGACQLAADHDSFGYWEG